MKMSEYLQKKDLENKKTTQDRMKELQDAEKRAREIRESLKIEKKKEFNEKIHNFHVFGMGFRPWALNDMVIFLVIGIIVLGALSFIPGKEVSSDTNNEGSFFTKLFGGFTVKSIDNTENTNQETQNLDISNTSENTDSTNGDSTQTETQTFGTNENTDNENIDLTDYNFEIKYKDSAFTALNSTGTDMIWYALNIRNLETYNIKCNIDHYVNDNLKDDKSTVTVESEKPMDINLREMKADAVDTLSKVKVVITCWDGINENTKNEKLQKLKFYFS